MLEECRAARTAPHAFSEGVRFLRSTYRPRLTAFLSSAPATTFVTFLAGIFRGAPVWGLRPVLALRELTEKVPNPTNVTLLPFFSVDTTPSSAELRALLAWTLEIFASFAILSINSPLFMCSLLEVSDVIVYNQPVRFISHGISGVKQLFKLKHAEMHG